MSVTNSVNAPVHAHRSGSVLTVVWIGLIAGTLDIGYNLIYNSFRHISPATVFLYIGSGLVGVTRIVRMGDAGVALGVLVHYSIAMTWTFIFYAASRKIAILWRRPIVSGLLYGCIVFGVMNFIAVPLSNAPHLKRHLTLFTWFYAVLVPLLLCIGLTISLLMKKYVPTAEARQG